MMAPFGAAFMLVGPVSGYLSDRYGSRGLTTIGLLVSAVGLLGLSTVLSTTSYWQLALYMALMGGGSGLFSSPNMNAIMSSVQPNQRVIAAGTNMMLLNTGQMLSIAIAFPLVLSKIPLDEMFHVFLFGGGMSGLIPRKGKNKESRILWAPRPYYNRRVRYNQKNLLPSELQSASSQYSRTFNQKQNIPRQIDLILYLRLSATCRAQACRSP